MAQKYEVTIPYTKEPWYTGYAIAENVTAAICLVWKDAIDCGWRGKPGKARVRVVQ